MNERSPAAVPGAEHLRIHTFRRVGRSLLAARRIVCGEVVVADTPVMSWCPDSVPWSYALRPEWFSFTSKDPVQQQQQQLHRPLDVPLFLVAAAASFCSPDTPAAAKRVVLDMHVPDLPIRDTLVDLVEFCQRYSLALSANIASVSEHNGNFAPEAQLDKTAVSLPLLGATPSASQILHAVMAAKVNAHRGSDGHWRIYPIASKLAHSCDPCCAYVPTDHNFVAIRHIAEGELLTMSYLGGAPLVLPAALRQQRLLNSHLFLCQCMRCRGPDSTRAFTCTCCAAGRMIRRTSPLIDSDYDLLPDVAWKCTRCQRECTDAALASTIEFESQFHECTSTLGLPGRPYKLADLTMHIGEALASNVLAGSHYLVVGLLAHLASYYGRLAAATRDSEVAELFLRWSTLSFVRHRAGLDKQASLLLCGVFGTLSDAHALRSAVARTSSEMNGDTAPEVGCRGALQVLTTVGVMPAELELLVAAIAATRSKLPCDATREQSESRRMKNCNALVSSLRSYTASDSLGVSDPESALGSFLSEALLASNRLVDRMRAS